MNNSTCSRRSLVKGMAGRRIRDRRSRPAGCATAKADGSAPSDAAFKIGVLQLTEHPASMPPTRLVAAVEERYRREDQSAKRPGRPVRLPDHREHARERGLRPDPRDRHPRRPGRGGATSDIPIVCTAITDFAASGLVKDNDAPAATSPAPPT
ncbi:MAG: hypothetical protein ACLTKG_05625 [Collinsella intestinalis]